jgi:hypothetical protein
MEVFDMGMAGSDLGQPGPSGASAGVPSLEVGCDWEPSPACITAGIRFGPAGPDSVTLAT